ncbi:MAG: efflux RND transporter periplasmic adaptor subunit [Desulfatiglans sp.]|jgi:HlyD family secretion protein|nr:efflux RND transporter periplasmic adaptor subunit [Desulfatiglans sp.]
MDKIENRKQVAEKLELHSGHGKKGRFKKYIIIIAVLIFIIVLYSFLAGQENKPASELYSIEQIERGELTVTVSATGSLEPRNQVDVGSELSGIVKSVDVDFNDHVTKGQTLATIDPSKLEAQVKQSKASLESANAKVLDAEATLTEMQNELKRLLQVWELSGKKIPSQNEIDSAEAKVKRANASLASAKAQVSQAKATLEANETDLSKMVIRSPINGIVLNRNIEPGQTVAASFQAPVLFTLAEDLTQMELRVAIDEADVGVVKNGQDATFSVDAYPERNFNASIFQVKFGSSAAEGVVTYETRLTVDNKELLLRPGMTATAEIIVDNIKDTILVPNASLRFEPPFIKDGADTRTGNRGLMSSLMPGPPGRFRNTGNQPEKKETSNKKVWVLKNNNPEQVEITTGSTDGNYTQVTSGQIEPGMNIITGMEGQ